MKRVLTVVAVVAAFGAALFAGPTAAPAAKSCGSYAGAPVIISGDVACRKARAIVKEFLKVRKSSIQGYNCKGSSTKVNCKSAKKRISWEK